MKLSQFKFNLPEELIAQHPTPERDESRLMVVNRATGEIEHRVFKEIINYFDEGDLFVFNDTKVFPARLYGYKEKTGARIEVFLLRELNAENKLWDVLVEPARKIRIGNKLYFGDGETMVAEIELVADADFAGRLNEHIPELVFSIEFAEQEHLDFGTRLFLVAIEARGKHLSVVVDKDVAIFKIVDDFLEHSMFNLAGGAVNDHHSRLVALRGGALCNQFVRQIEFKLR